MAEVRMYPILPVADVDAAITFYEAIGFVRTYRQVRPNPHAVMARGELAVHLAGIAGFDPEQSYASVIVVVPDPDALYEAFAAGLRQFYGKLPVSGIPRITRPRKRYGTVTGFSLVDVGGNWLRVSRAGDTEEETEHADSGLARIIEVAARLADSKGDDAGALKTLESGIRRHSDAPPMERARALLYQADLAVRVGDMAKAQASMAELNDLSLGEDERDQVAEEIEHVALLISGR